MSTYDIDSQPQPTSELPPFVFVPGAGTIAPAEPPVPPESPAEGDPAPRRWSTRHRAAAAVVACGVLVSGGVAWAARDTTGAAPGPGIVGPAAGQQPGPGQLGGPGQLPGTVPGQAPDDGTTDDDGVDT